MTPTEDPGARPGRNRPGRPRRGNTAPAMITRGLAILVAVAILMIGGLIGYIARGGPDAPTDLTLITDIPTVTVTVPAR
ncbi:MAG: hypothetical protein EXQ74_02210 [Thermoleophilia bacterium]|nr:hypothetical protein [Thermoleophilia bacterium]